MKLQEQQSIHKRKELSSVGRSYKLYAIIKEFNFVTEQNPIVIFLKQLFEQSGKLKPKKKQIAKVEVQGRNTLTININIMKGQNLPVRKEKFESFYQQIQSGNFGGGGGGGGFGGDRDE